MIWRPFFSLMSVSTTLIMFTAFALCCWILTRNAHWNTVKAVVIGCCLVAVRFLLPFEFPGANVIRLGIEMSKPFYWFKHTTVLSISILQWLGIIWLTGALITLSFLAFRLLRQAKLIRIMPETEDLNLQHCFYSCVKMLNPRYSGKIIVSDSFASPMMVGFFKPHILLPASMAAEPDTALRYVLLHELMHYRKNDLWYKLVLEIICCLLWWNPAAYLLRTCVDQLLELRCDSLVCRNLSPRETVEYAEVLLKVVKTSHASKSLVIAGHFGYSGNARIIQRFTQLLKPSKKSRRTVSVLIITVALICFVFSYSCTIQLTNAPDSTEITGNIDIMVNQETDFILRYPDGTIELYRDNHLYAELRSSVLEEEPFCYLTVYDVNISYD